MILLSHRGNIDGKNEERENAPDYIQQALDKGYEVEIDVWYKDDEWYLGHDEPTYHINVNWLRNKKLWCHAKNIQGLYSMFEDNIHCFFHQEDDVTLTSNGYMWTYPGKDLTKNSIAVLPSKKPKVEVAGICSDFIKRLKDE